MSSFLVFLLLLSPSAMARHQVISVIKSDGFQSEQTEKIKKTLGIAVGGRLNPQRIDEGIRQLHKQGVIQTLFVETEESGGQVVVVLRGTRLRKLKEIRFKGLEDEWISQLQSSLELEPGKTIEVRSVSQLKERIRAVMENQGYYSAEVSVEIKDLPETGEADVEIAVVPGGITRVSKIALSGSEKEELTGLRRVINLRKGEPFTRSKLEEDVGRINQYLKDNQYSTSKVDDVQLEFSDDKSSVNIVFLVQFADRFQFQFLGNTVFEEVHLRELLTDDLLTQSDLSNRVVAAIKEKYRAIGYHFVEVEVSASKQANNKTSMTRFKIDEGPKVIIDQVEFKGNLDIPERKLRSLFFEVAPGVLARGLFWEEGLKEAVDKMSRRLEEMGYLKASVSVPRAIFSEDRKGVRLFFDIEFGTRTFFGTVELEGFTRYPREDILDLIPLRNGDPFNPQEFDEGKKRILEKYHNDGFVDARWAERGTQVPVYLGDSPQSVLRLSIIEGPEYRVGSVRVDGAKITKEEVILREMKLSAGDKFSPELLQESEEGISTLGLFSRVEIMVTKNPSDPLRKDLVVMVRETRPGLGEVGLGGVYEDPRFRLRTFLALAYRNVGGMNQTATLRNEFSLPFSRDLSIPFLEYSSIIGYRAPYPFGLPVTFAAQVGLDRFEVSITGPKIQTRARIEGRIEKKLSSAVTLNYRLLRYEFTKTEVISTREENKDIIGSTGPGLILDLRDDIFNPTKGSLHALDIELAHPIFLSQPNIAFMMALLRNTFYMPLVSPLGLALYGGVGYAASLLPDQPLPTARRVNDLSLGGQGSIRGFGVRRFFPGPESHQSAFYNFRAEVTTPLFSNISGAIFFDTGRIFPNLTASDATPRHDGIGVGVRYKTPVGPIVIDVAQGLGADRENVKFSLTVGTL